MGIGGRKCLRVLLVVVFVLGLGGWGEGCWEQEKLALLQLKAFLEWPALYGWVEEEGKESSDCCQWERVECDATTGRVIGLSLAYTSRVDSTQDWYLNASLFLPFEELRTLFLRGNQIAGCLDNEGFEKLALKLKKLEVLDLSGNSFNDSSILSSLIEISSLKSLDLSYNSLAGHLSLSKKLSGALEILDLTNNELDDNFLVSLNELSSLKYLNLSSNLINGSIHNTELKNLINLKELDLSDNDIKSLDSFHGLINLEVLTLSFHNPNNSILFLGPFSECLKHLYIYNYGFSEGSIDIKGVLQLKKLESLKMDGIPLQNSFLQDIGAMISLKVLSLSDCGLNGTLSTQGICQLRRLEELDFSNNMLTGVLPDCFSNLTFLQRLDLSSNQFCGSLLAISPLQSLTYIDLSSNQFQIPSSLNPFFNNSKLKHFYGDNNNIYWETELHSLAPRFQLNVIYLSCCGDAGPLPKFLYHQHELQSVDLSNINLTGEFPSWLFKNNTELETLFLINNSLSGQFRLVFHSTIKFSELDVSSNCIDGHIPVEIGAYLPGLISLNISNNCLVGSIPSSIGDMKSLETLDLSNNRLQGPIFPANLNLTNLRKLYLAGNNFTGSIPNSLSNCSSLSEIDIGYNHLSGEIPRWMGNLSLSHIRMRYNHIEGPIPMEFCQHAIQVLDLSMNNISETLPSCICESSVKYIQLSKNRLRGRIPNTICNNFGLVALDLSDNQLTGTIPNCFDNMSHLGFLVLKHNNLEGEIPNQLCQLDKLSLIDLSHNNLSGRIPNCLNVTPHEEVEVTIRTYEELTKVTRYTTIEEIPGDCKRGDPCQSVPHIPNLSDMNTSIELTTKSISYSYNGKILRYLSGIDLSSNKLIGEIPREFGNFQEIVMLNLSHNSLAGPIPPSLSNLKNIESLDLSYNNLSGSIPLKFVELYSLTYFNVSYNNLTGKPPPRIAQFASDFDENSYWGNPCLCGEPLPKNCSTTKNQPAQDGEDTEDGGLIDIEAFYVTFIVSYVMVLLCIAAVMYINPYWRQAWFYFIERGLTSCFYFVIDNLPTQFHCGNI